ncbi:TMEM175 family protein [Chloroflexota bacterium]
MKVSDRVYTGAQRVEALTDGVFAIVMTLLVLELSIPIITEDAVQTELLYRLGELLPELYSFALSFLVLGMLWSSHRVAFSFIRHSDSILVFLNIIFLMFVSLIPFSTALMGEYFLEKIPLIIYGANLMMTYILRFFIWNYATGNYRLVDSDLECHVIRGDKIVWICALVIILATMGIALISATAATIVFYLMIVFLIVMFIRGRVLTFGRRATKKEEHSPKEDNSNGQ